MIKVAIIGATGYTGIDAIEIILRHPNASLVYLSASSSASVPVAKVHPRLVGRCELDIEPFDIGKLAKAADVALCCLPHKVSMEYVPLMLEAGLKVVDLSADYRLKDIGVYEKYYAKHTDPANIERAVYGLPELYRKQIGGASLIANPGCFPTSSTLAIAPLLSEKVIDPACIVVNSVSGASGAGKKTSDGLHFPNLNENLRPYSIGTHRHAPEMEQIASELIAQKVGILFQPHIGCFDRGILSSVYCEPKISIDTNGLYELFSEFYADEPFVQVLKEPPSVKDVANTNYCHIHTAFVGGKIVVFSAIDNLVKGASGQAVQNMNLIFGIDERAGLL